MIDPNEKQKSSRQLFACPECLSGWMHLKHIPYFTWLNQELVIVPSFPAWVCDLCGRREYDPKAVTWLNALLSPEAKSRKIKRRRITPASDLQEQDNQPLFYQD